MWKKNPVNFLLLHFRFTVALKRQWKWIRMIWIPWNFKMIELQLYYYLYITNESASNSNCEDKNRNWIFFLLSNSDEIEKFKCFLFIESKIIWIGLMTSWIISSSSLCLLKRIWKEAFNSTAYALHKHFFYLNPF